MELDRLIDAASEGDLRALGRLCSVVERGDRASLIVSAQLYPSGGSAWTTGITGAPGAGKSTLVSELVRKLVPSGDKAAILAVDPTSPITGGAILGDRIRMGVHAADPNIFIRSLASRGHLGGISTATPAMASCLDGLGFSEIFVETVGVGQSEVDIASSADTTIVVVTAGWGDAVQAAKAGFLEVADVFVVNKADRDGADSTAKDIEAMLDIGPTMSWCPPVIKTVASEGAGVSDVADAVRRHREFLVETGTLRTRRRRRAAHDLAMAIRANIDRSVATDELAADLLDAISDRRTDPWTEAERLLQSDRPAPDESSL
jgi:LAO/AO transport system kinase